VTVKVTNFFTLKKIPEKIPGKKNPGKKSRKKKSREKIPEKNPGIFFSEHDFSYVKNISTKTVLSMDFHDETFKLILLKFETLNRSFYKLFLKAFELISLFLYNK